VQNIVLRLIKEINLGPPHDVLPLKLIPMAPSYILHKNIFAPTIPKWGYMFSCILGLTFLSEKPNNNSLDNFCNLFLNKF